MFSDAHNIQYSHALHYSIKHESPEYMRYQLVQLLLLLKVFLLRFSGKMISAVGRDFHLWNVSFSCRVCVLSFGRRFHLVPFFHVCVYALFISHPLYTNIWLITFIIYLWKMMKKMNNPQRRHKHWHTLANWETLRRQIELAFSLSTTQKRHDSNRILSVNYIEAI